MKAHIALLAVLALTQAPAAQTRTDEDVRRILVERLEGFEDRVGIVVGIVDERGRRVIAHGATSANGRPVDADTLFEAGSITKVFTALVLADMVERREVALDDPVAKFLPPQVKVPERNGRRITLHDLSTHRSGLPRMPANFSPKDPLRPYVDYAVERMYGFLSAHELRRDIDAQYEYSNLGFGLLGHALARRAGTDYETLVRDRMFVPLRMASTTLTATAALQPRLAAGHSSAFHLAPTPHWELTDAFRGAGGVLSSVNDLLTFLEANLGFTKTSLAGAMARTVAVRRDGGDSFKMGLGWRIERRNGREIVWHGGATYGFRTFAGYDREARVGVVVLANYNSGSGIDDIGMYLLNGRGRIDDGAAPKPKKRVPSVVPSASLDAYDGRYQFSNKQVWTVRRDGRRFWLTKGTAPEIEIFPEGDFEKGNDDFFQADADAIYTFGFEKSSESKASELILNFSFQEPERAARIE